MADGRWVDDLRGGTTSSEATSPAERVAGSRGRSREAEAGVQMLRDQLSEHIDWADREHDRVVTSRHSPGPLALIVTDEDEAPGGARVVPPAASESPAIAVD